VSDIPVVRIRGGDDVVFPLLRFKQGGLPLDVSGWTFTSQWRTRAGAAQAITLTVNTSRADEGVVWVSASGAQTAAMLRSGVWDLQGVKDGKTRTFAGGRTVWKPDVTRG
jgi:hypothetical protein